MKHATIFILSLVGFVVVLMYPEQGQSQEAEPEEQAQSQEAEPEEQAQSQEAEPEEQAQSQEAEPEEQAQSQEAEPVSIFGGWILRTADTMYQAEADGDLAPVIPPFMSRVCSGYGPVWTELQTPSVSARRGWYAASRYCSRDASAR